MRVADLYSPNVRSVAPDQALVEAARLLCEEHVGALVVLRPDDAARRPIGMLTDRDIVRGQLTRSADLFCLTVGDVMSSRAHVVTPDLEISEAIAALNGHGVRRAPVVDPAGRLIGIVSLDDLLPALASDLEQLAQLMGTQARHERAPYFAGRARP